MKKPPMRTVGNNVLYNSRKNLKKEHKRGKKHMSAYVFVIKLSL